MYALPNFSHDVTLCPQFVQVFCQASLEFLDATTYNLRAVWDRNADDSIAGVVLNLSYILSAIYYFRMVELILQITAMGRIAFFRISYHSFWNKIQSIFCMSAFAMLAVYWQAESASGEFLFGASAGNYSWYVHAFVPRYSAV